MALLICWLLLPLLAAALALGTGLLVQAAAGRRPPPAMLVPVGLAGVIAVGQVTTAWSWLAPATVPAVVVVALAGAVVGRRALARPDWWAVAAAAGAFLVAGAPVFLSGQPTFAGYTILGDTSIHLIGADALLSHGRSFAALPPSSYSVALTSYYASAGYPSGGPVLVGTLARLVGQDPAWSFQPVLSLLIAALALAVYALIARIVPARPWRAGIAFIAAQPALLVSYALQGSIKEIATVAAVTIVAALVEPWAADRRAGARAAIPLAVASAAAIAVVGPAAGIWLAPLLLVALVAALRRRRTGAWRALAAAGATFVLVTVALSWQSVQSLKGYLDVAGAVVTSQGESGNLYAPLKLSQAAGIWLSGDYRQPPVSAAALTFELIGVVLIAALFGLVQIVRRRPLGLTLYAAVSAFAWWYVTRTGSPWADAKALAIVSPAMLLVALVGAASLAGLGRRVEGVAIGLVIAGGVLASNALSYHHVALAPRDRLDELGSVGARLAGSGPTLFPEFEEFGKHFLRAARPEDITEAWQAQPAVPSASAAGPPHFGFSADLDQVASAYVDGFPQIVLRRGFADSRPPDGFRRVWQGRWYEIWRRDAHPVRVLAHVPLGVPGAPSAVPRCRDLLAQAALARRSGAELALALRPEAPLMAPAKARHSPGWVVDPGNPLGLVPVSPGTVQGTLTVPRAGRFDLWLEGSFGRGYTVSVDGRRIGAVAYALNGREESELVATLQLAAGRHGVTLVRAGGDLRPGNALDPRVGPLAVVPAGEPEPVRTVAPAAARRWCGRALDWIEVVRPA